MGYGDINATNKEEAIICSVVMVLGVMIYSYIIGSLTNILSNVDSLKAKLDRKLEILSEITKEFNLSKVFVKKLTSSLEYEHAASRHELDDLV